MAYHEPNPNVDGLLEKIQGVVTDLTKAKPRANGARALPARVHYLDLPPAPAAAAAVESDGLWEYGQILRRHKWVVLLLALVCTAATIALSLPQRKIYQASGTLELLSINENFLNLKEVDPTAGQADQSTEAYLETQLRILQSESLADRVVGKLGLEGRPEFAAAPGRGWRNRLRLAPETVWEPRRQARRTLLENLKVRQARASRILEISCDSTDPRLAAEIVNTLSEEYIQQSVEVRWNATQRTGQWLTGQLEDLKSKLVKSEQALQNYARANGLVITSEKDNVAETKLRQVQDELSRAQAERMTRQSRYEQAATAAPESLPEVLDSSLLRDYQLRLAELRRQWAELRPSLKPAHYRIQRLESQVAEVEAALAKERQNILDRVRHEYQAALRREELLQAAYRSQTGQVSGQAASAIHYGTLKREVDTNRQLYESMLQKVKEAGIASAMRAINVRVVDRATPPAEPYKPNVPLNAGLGFLSGCCLGIVFVFLRERGERVRVLGDRSIKGPGDSPVYLQVPELGVIPIEPVSEAAASPPVKRYLPLGNGNGCANGNTVTRVELSTSNRRPSIVAESFRATMTSILFSAQGARPSRVLVVTSPAPGEGKTTAVSNLAIALADVQGPVLIIDADLRQPQMHDVFGLSNTRGLSDLLQESKPLRNYPSAALALETRMAGLYCLPAGPEPRNIAHLLYSPRLAELVRRFRQEFPMVLIDTPPMLHIPDARIIGRLADSVVLVLRAGQTTQEAAVAARQRLAEDGTPVLGTILNHWDPATCGERYGSGYYSQYYYGSREQK